MKKRINWNVRLNNPTFVIQLLVSLFGPILVYMGMNYYDLTTWSSVIDVLKAAALNPIVLGATVWAIYTTITDPTTNGFKDSQEIINMVLPPKKEEENKEETK